METRTATVADILNPRFLNPPLVVKTERVDSRTIGFALDTTFEGAHRGRREIKKESSETPLRQEMKTGAVHEAPSRDLVRLFDRGRRERWHSDLARLKKSRYIRFAIYVTALSFQVLIASPVGAQIPRELPSGMQQDTTAREIIRQLEASGLTRAQVRARLQQMGQDPGLADPYYDAMESGAEVAEGQDPSLLATLRELAYVPPQVDTLEVDSLLADTMVADSSGPGGLPVFGRELFQRRTNQFHPVVYGPVDPDYRLGPGDQIGVVLTGDVEDAYSLNVNREGFIVVPHVGQVVVNGMTLRDLQEHLYQRFGRVYSGIRKGPGATAFFQLSLGRLRTNQVFVIGEVERPGAYQLQATGTAVHALYEARGPSVNGSFRRIQLRRGGRIVTEVDLYDYLLRGDSRSDVRLEHGDVLFVPVVGPQVGVKGAVRRQAAYEIEPDEDLRDIMSFAGGAHAQVLLTRVQVDRILPPIERAAGRARVLVDVELARLLNQDSGPIPIFDGDIIQVFTISDERRNRVILTGEVRQPGVYEWSPGTSLWSILHRAEGLREQAYTLRAHIFRLNAVNETRQLIRTPLLTDEHGSPNEDVVLSDRDSIVVYSVPALANPPLVKIHGLVKNPGVYPLADGMTPRDLIIAAGGFVRGAGVDSVDVARRPDARVRTDTTATLFHLAVSAGHQAYSQAHPLGNGNGDAGWLKAPDWATMTDEFVLMPDDEVFVRKAPGYEEPRTVKVTGEVVYPGTYVLSTRQTRLLDVLSRAGFVTSEGNTAGLRLMRDNRLVATDYDRAQRHPNSRYNLDLETGDSIHVPRFDPTVTVHGAVAFDSRVLYRPGRGLDYYIHRSGGYAQQADRGGVSVTYQDGERASVGRRFLMRRTPRVTPLSTIFVPALAPDEREGFDLDQFLSRSHHRQYDCHTHGSASAAF